MDGFTWQHIQFANGSNPYICKTEREFKRIKRKYKLTKIKNGFWLAEEKNASQVVVNYFQDAIKKSWTWNKLTEEEQQRFVDMVIEDNIFDRIKGKDKTRIEWFNTIYHSFLFALGYKSIGWREIEEEKEMPKF